MVNEDYCSFEVAQLLKEKGFDELCIFKYSSEGVRMKAGVAIDEWQNSELDDDECSCVSLQMAMKWLRGKGIFIQIGIVGHSTITVPEDYYFFKVYKDRRFISYEKTETYHTYEETVEAALKYTLENLI